MKRNIINRFKNLIKKNSGITYIEIMIALSILGIAMTYMAIDSRYSARAIYALNETDRMLYASYEAIERYKLDKSTGNKSVNGYTVSIEATTNPADDPNLTAFLARAKITVYPKDTDSEIGNVELVTYVLGGVAGGAYPQYAPQNLTAVPTISGIVLEWDSVANAGSYNVKRSTEKGGPYITIASGVTENTYLDTSADDNIIYYYVVSAANTAGESPDSAETSVQRVVNVTTLYPVADSYVEASKATRNYGSSNSMYVQGGNTYRSYIKFDLPSISGTIIDINLRVYSNGNAEVCEYPDNWTEAGITASNAPDPGTWVQIGSFEANWAWNYYDTNVTGYSKAQVAGDKIASFALLGTNSSRGTVYPREFSGREPMLVIRSLEEPPPPVPVDLKAAAGDAQVSLSWDKVTGAEAYNVKRSSTSGGPYTTIQNTEAISFTDTGLTNGTTYFYVVSSVNSTESSNSNEVVATPNPLITLAINPDDDAYIRNGTYAGNNFGSEAVLEVRNDMMDSSDRRESYLKFDLTGIKGEISEARIRLYGNNTTDSTGASMGVYDVSNNAWQESTITSSNAPVKGNEIGTIVVDNMQGYKELDITDYLKTQMEGDKIINIAISGKGTAKLLSFNSKESLGNKPELVIVKRKTPPDAPEDLNAIPANNKINLNWTVAAGADSYNIKRSLVDGGTYTTIQTEVANLTYTDTTVTNGNTYYYVVTVVNAEGESINSNQVSAVPEEIFTVTVNPVADAAIDINFPNDNYGNDTAIYAKNNGDVDEKRSYIRFDLSGHTADRTAISAKLRLYGKAGSNKFMLDVFGTSDNNWNESGAYGITWNNAPPIEDKLLSQSIKKKESYYEFIITSYVQECLRESNQVNIALYTLTDSSDYATFNSKESASYKPELIVDFKYDMPARPENLVVMGGNTTADLSWSPDVNAVSYNVKRSTTVNGTYSTIASGITGTTYRDTGLTNGFTYYYAISAINSEGESSKSVKHAAIPQNGVPTRVLIPVDDVYTENGTSSALTLGLYDYTYASLSNVSDDSNSRHSFIKFDLSDLTGTPTGAKLVLRARNEDSSTVIVNIYKILEDSWSEHSLTWNNEPGTDIFINAIAVTTTMSTFQVDITSLFNNELAGDKEMSLGLRSVTANKSRARFDSKESASANVQLLQVYY